MKTKILSIMTLLLLGLIAISGIAHANSVPLEIQTVYLNNREVAWDCTYDAGTDSWNCGHDIRGDLLRGNSLEVEVKLRATDDDDYVEIQASLTGLDYDRDRARAYSDVFSVREGRTYYKVLEIELPQRMDQDKYLLRIEAANRVGHKQVYNLMLDVQVPRNAIEIRDVIFSPHESVKAGRALYVVPRLRNIGQREQDVKVTVSIPELGIKESDYVDAIEREETVTAKELYLRIPECVEAGMYKVIVTVEYNDRDNAVSKEYSLKVTEGDFCETGKEDEAGKTIVTIGSDMQQITAGQGGAVYPITLSNTGRTAKTYTITTVAGDWATMKVSPSVVVLNPEETKFVYVSVAANDGTPAGEKTFSVNIKSGETTLREVVLRTDVLEGKSTFDGLRRGLEVALVVLVVLLIVVGLIVGFSKLRDNEDEDEEFKEESYY